MDRRTPKYPADAKQLEMPRPMSHAGTIIDTISNSALRQQLSYSRAESHHLSLAHKNPLGMELERLSPRPRKTSTKAHQARLASASVQQERDHGLHGCSFTASRRRGVSVAAVTHPIVHLAQRAGVSRPEQAFGASLNTGIPAYQQQLWRWQQDGAGVDMPNCRSAFAIAELFSKVYAIGGITLEEPYDGGPSAAVDVYDPISQAWSRGPPLHHARTCHGVYVTAGRIYVAGGRGVSGPLASLEAFVPETNSWHLMECMPEPMATTRLSMFGGDGSVLHAVGHKVFAYHVDKDYWEKPRKIMPPGRQGCEVDEPTRLPSIARR